MSETISTNLQTFDVLVQQQAAAIQTNTKKVLNFNPGSVLRAICEAVAGIALWLQGLILNLLLVTRAATSTGADLDTWVADFGVTRLFGSAATCATAQLTRYSASQQVVIAPGGTLQTGDGSVQFTIIADTGQSGYSASLGGYVMAPGVASVQATVQCTIDGTVGNVAANTITALASGIVGVDIVNNTGPAAGGVDDETDAALRKRFQLYLLSLWRATKAAVTYGAQTSGANLTVTITENQDEAGNYKPGYFFVVVDDGSGDPRDSTITAVAAAVEQYRGLAITYGVHKPTVVTVDLVATINVAVGYSGSAMVAAATNAGAAFINSCVLAQSLSYFNTGSAITNASPGISEVVTLTLNGTQADIEATAVQKIVAGTVTVTVA